MKKTPLVCPTEIVPDNTVVRDDGWRGFRVCGTRDFSLIGILAWIAEMLAANEISIFAISTYKTDYILVKEENFDKAAKALKDSIWLKDGSKVICLYWGSCINESYGQRLSCGRKL